VVAVVAWVLFSGETPATRAAPPVPSFGTIATADPCSLIDTTALGKFGDPNLASDNDNFNQCDDIVKSDGGEVNITVVLENEAPPNTIPDGTIENTPTVSIVRIPESRGHCDRQILLLADHHRVVISAQLNKKPVSHDLCGMADATTATAADEIVVVDVTGTKGAGHYCDLAQQVAVTVAPALPGP
jgi:hypothetical protein